MQLNSDVLNRIQYLIGSPEIVMKLPKINSKAPFDAEIVGFLNLVSKVIMKDPRAKAFSDVVTFAFWIRKSSILKSAERFAENGIRLGKGVVFHIAPSNVPVNFAFSLVSGLITGNANVVRVPSKDFLQIGIIVDAFNVALNDYKNLRPYLICVRYGRDKDVNDLFSSIADVRVIWGGDQTISELRNSPLPPRSGEITFADRYSLAIIDSDCYLSIGNKKRIAEDFYNDTYLTDQNACTSPRIIVWTGSRIEKAKEEFWAEEHKLVLEKYSFQPIQGVDKLTKAYLMAADHEAKIEDHQDNLIIRISVPEIYEDLMEFRGNSGFFYEYNCKNLLEIRSLCDDKRCQTIGYIGEKESILPLLESGVKGIDRVVPVGRTMDFDLIWDGYNLVSMMTRTVTLQ